ncbi:MAG: OsmC family protein [Gaiellaceae bacterium]
MARPKRLEYVVTASEGLLLADGEGPLEPGEAWTPEHLALAGLARCTLTSLDHHAGRAGISVKASASAAGAVTKRESDGRYAFVELDVTVEAELEPEPPEPELSDLLAKAERDCFVGASLTEPPRYRWRVNGRDYSY